MKHGSMPTALERLIQPLPSDLKAAILEAWKNEDIPHDENDSVYRLMVLLTLHARFYQDMATIIATTADSINQAHTIYLGEVRATYAKQSGQNEELADDLKTIVESVSDLRKVMDEKPKALRSQLESEMKSLFSDLRSEGQGILKEFTSYTIRFKEDCEELK